MKKMIDGFLAALATVGVGVMLAVTTPLTPLGRVAKRLERASRGERDAWRRSVWGREYSWLTTTCIVAGSAVAILVVFAVAGR